MDDFSPPFPRGNFADPDLFLVLGGSFSVYDDVIVAPTVRGKERTSLFHIAWNNGTIHNRMAPTESDEQIVLKSILRMNKIPANSVPNGGFRSTNVAAKMKREGMEAGFPDMIVWGNSIVCVELKKENGKLSDFSLKQLKWLERLSKINESLLVVGAFGYKAALGYLVYAGYDISPHFFIDGLSEFG